MLVVSGIRLYCDGLSEILLRRESVTVSACAGNVTAACQALDECEIDVILVDIAEPAGLSALHAVIEHAGERPVVALAVPNREPDIVACAEAGAAGFVTREASSDELVAALEAAACGEVACAPWMTAAILRRLSALARPYSPWDAPGGDDPGLTGREREILELIEAGLSNKMIARRLSIELATVKNHVHHIISKLGVSSRAQAVAVARRRWRPDA